MKTIVRITIDLKVQNRRWPRVPFFTTTIYAKATYEGEMDLGEVAVGHTLSLQVFNSLPTRFSIRGIEKIPDLKTGKTQNLIELYVQTRSVSLGSGKIKEQNLQECVARLNGPIREQLSHYGIMLVPDSAKVGPEPTYYCLPSTVGTDGSCF